MTNVDGRPRWRSVCLASTALLAAAAGAAAQSPGNVMAEVRIAEGSGGFAGPLDAGDEFGVSSAPLGDVDGDGIGDVAVGSRNDDDGGTNRGAVWVLFLDDDGSVKAEQKISATAGGFTGDLGANDRFGVSTAGLGDLDGDGVPDLAVGASGDDDGGTNRGAVWVLFLRADGTVKAHQKISDTQGSFFGRLNSNDLLGASVANTGDLDGDGVVDLAVGAPFDDDGGTDRGAVWLLYLRTDGTVRAYGKISDTAGSFTGPLERNDLFGDSVAGLGDLDGDGVNDLAVGARGDDDGGPDQGAVWLLFLTDTGRVGWHQKISSTAGGFVGDLDPGDNFGVSMTPLDDLDGDGARELAVGAFFDDDGGDDRGAVWVLFLDPAGQVLANQKISAAEGGFTGPLSDGDWFGSALGATGDLDGDGMPELAVGARQDGGEGALWVLSLDRVSNNDCPADQNGDGDVDHLDLSMLLAAWGPCGGGGCPEDMDYDGVVAFTDLLILLRAWGPCDAEERGMAWRSKRQIRQHLRPQRTRSKEGLTATAGRLSLQKQWRLTNRALFKVRREHWNALTEERMRLRQEGHTVQDGRRR